MNGKALVEHNEHPEETTDASAIVDDIRDDMLPDDRIKRARPENPFCAVEIE